MKASQSAGHTEDLLREKALYDALIERCPATAARLPLGVWWDADSGELHMEEVPAPNLAEHVTSEGTLDPAVAGAVGRAVGDLHREAGVPGPDVPRSDWLRGGLGVVRPTPRRLRLLSGGGLELLKMIQRSELEARLRALAPPSGDALVHGDLRWENVLVGQRDDPRVWLVDWEMGGAGERVWDAGCFAAACVSAWLCSIPAVPEVPPERLAGEADLPMEALAPGLRAFWCAYRESAPPAGGDAWIERCAELAAVRLVHSGFECTESDTGLHPCAVAHVQVAAHLLHDPAHAARDLLGMS